MVYLPLSVKPVYVKNNLVECFLIFRLVEILFTERQNSRSEI